jgi:phage-related tail fiber protein
MVGTLQPLDSQFAIVDDQGRPTIYFTRWAQQKQNDIGDAQTEEQVQALIDAWAALRQIIAGRALDGGGFLSGDVTIDHAESLVTPGTFGDATHVPTVRGRPRGARSRRHCRSTLIVIKSIAGGLINAANDAAAAAAGIAVDGLYRNGSVVMIRVV